MTIGFVLRPLLADDVGKAARAWTAALQSSFPLSARLLAMTIFDDPNHRIGDAAVVEREGELCGFGLIKRSITAVGTPPEGFLAMLFVRPEFRQRGVGTMLLQYLERRGEAAGCRKLHVAGGLLRLLPGVPAEDAEALSFLERRGYRRTVRRRDLGRDISDYASRINSPSDCEIVPATDQRALVSLVDGEFPRSWSRHLRWSLEHGAALDDTLVIATSRGLQGFCRTYPPGASPPGPSTYWAAATGPAACGLGPIGVSADVRRRGLGRSLVDRALVRLRERGGRYCVIDSINEVGFYEPFGFAMIHTYERLEKPFNVG